MIAAARFLYKLNISRNRLPFALTAYTLVTVLLCILAIVDIATEEERKLYSLGNDDLVVVYKD